LRFVVTGGGTGGHIYPALAIARGLKERFSAEVVYIGGTRGLESEIVSGEGLTFKSISLAGLQRGISPANLLAGWKAAMGIKSALGYIRKIKPSAVIGTGGYVCGPVVLAAALLRIPTLINEQNALPGITNRILSRFTGYVAATFADSKKFFPAKTRIRVTGLPVRKEIMAAGRDEARKKLGIGPSQRLILSFGGSQGAKSINGAMLQVLKYYNGKNDICILHVTGPKNYAGFINELENSINIHNGGNITINSYMYDMPGALAAADLVICRAGAATLAELTAIGLPSILVPYPYAAENHQEYNARALERRGAAVVIKDSDLNGKLLVSEIERLIGQGKLPGMSAASKSMGKPGALDDILDCIQDLLDNKRK